MIMLLTSCSHKIYNPEIDGAKYLTELLNKDIEEPAMYPFCDNLLVCGNGKVLIISPKTGKILKKLTVASSLVAYVGNETFILKFTDSFIVYDKDLKEIKRYECDNSKPFREKNFITPGSEMLFTFNINDKAAIFRQSLKTGERKLLLDAVSLNVLTENRNSNYIVFSYKENQDSAEKWSYLDLNSGEIIPLNLEGSYNNVTTDGTNVLVNKNDRNNDYLIITPEKIIEFKELGNYHLLNDKKHLYVYNKTICKLQILNLSGEIVYELKIPSQVDDYGYIRDEIFDLFYNEETNSYFFIFTYKKYVPCIFEWKPEFK